MIAQKTDVVGLCTNILYKEAESPKVRTDQYSLIFDATHSLLVVPTLDNPRSFPGH